MRDEGRKSVLERKEAPIISAPKTHHCKTNKKKKIFFSFLMCSVLTAVIFAVGFSDLTVLFFSFY